MFSPTLFFELRRYSSQKFYSDLSAGLIVGIVSLPLSIAFAIASGVSPERGLITAFLAGFIISFLGGTTAQIGGPTGAFVVIIFGIVEKFGYSGLQVATIMAGVFLLILGISRLGNVIQFIPIPVTIGFTSGIAVIIFTGQVADLLGLNAAGIGADFIARWSFYLQSLEQTNLVNFALGLGSMAVILLWPKITRKIPGPLVAVVASSLLVYFLGLPVDTIGSRFHNLSSTLPPLRLPEISLTLLRDLLPAAVSIALLGGIESLLSAVVADGMTGKRHNSNMELIAQGAANVVSPLLGGIPATGAIARTATNIRNGAVSPVAGLINATFIGLSFFFLGDLMRWIPMASLAAVLMIVAYNMSEWRAFRSLLKGSRSDALVLAITFFLTVVIDLTVAIEVGMVLAAILFMRRAILAADIHMVPEAGADPTVPDLEILDPQGLFRKKIHVFEVSGPFFFGTIYKFEQAMADTAEIPQIQIIRLKNVPFIDATGLYRLKEAIARSRDKGVEVYLSGPTPIAMKTLQKGNVAAVLGSGDRIFKKFHEAWSHAVKQLDMGKS